MNKLLLLLLINPLLGYSQYTSIPDPNFERYLIESGIDFNPTPDQRVRNIDIENITILQIGSSYDIFDLTGIEAFVSLEKLYLNYNHLTSLDVSNNNSLTHIEVGWNQITSFDYNRNVLQTVNLKDNQLSYIDLSNSALISVDLQNNLLTSINLNGNYLDWVDVSNNQLTTINFENHPTLRILRANYNQISSVGVTNADALERLSLFSNMLSSIDVSNNGALISLTLGENQFTSIDLSNTNSLKYLDVAYNQLTTLDLTNNSNLLEVYAFNNDQLTEIDIRNGNNLIMDHFRAHIIPNLNCIYVDDASYCESSSKWVIGENSNFVENEFECQQLNLKGFTSKFFEKIYPNPTTSIVTMQSDKEYDIEVYDMAGNKVMALTGNTIDMSHLSSATYIVKALDKVENEEVSYKVVKN